MNMFHPAGITVEIVGIEASGNGRSCDRHNVCGSVLDDDVVVRLRRVQIINSTGGEETAITAYLVSDGIDQCRVGFLQRHFVAHAGSFDGVLAQVTEVYSITSDSPIKRKKCRHNMGCCLAALITDLPENGGICISLHSTRSFLNRLASRQDEEDEEEDNTTRLLLQRNEAIAAYDDPPHGGDAPCQTAPTVLPPAIELQPAQEHQLETTTTTTPASAAESEKQHTCEENDDHEENVAKLCCREHDKGNHEEKHDAISSTSEKKNESSRQSKSSILLRYKS